MPRKLKCSNAVCGITLNQTASLTNKNGIRLNNGICFNKKGFKSYLIGEINKGKNLEDGTLLDPNRSPITKTEFNRSGLRYNSVIASYNAGRHIDDNDAYIEDDNDAYIEEPAVMDAGQMYTYIMFAGNDRGVAEDRRIPIADAAATRVAARVARGDGFQDDIIDDAIAALDAALEDAATGRGNKRKTRRHQNKKTRKTRKIKRKSRK